MLFKAKEGGGGLGWVVVDAYIVSLFLVGVF